MTTEDGPLCPDSPKGQIGTGGVGTQLAMAVGRKRHQAITRPEIIDLDAQFRANAVRDTPSVGLLRTLAEKGLPSLVPG